MRPMIHTLSCNIVVDPAKKDRFFMDMRVYEIVAQHFEPEATDSRSLLWRGIYLAVEVNSSPKIGTSLK